MDQNDEKLEPVPVESDHPLYILYTSGYLYLNKNNRITKRHYKRNWRNSSWLKLVKIS